jgi:type II secretory pathway component PulK
VNGRRLPARPGRGMALVMVLGALAVITLVAARFAQRIHELQQQIVSLDEHAQQRLHMRNALAATLYLTATRSVGPAGLVADNMPELRADDRRYRLPGGGVVQLQDPRGLLSLNAPDRRALSALLVSAGVATTETDAFVDVLEDYLDTDNLKRLNGAEMPEYAALGLPPPRNDYLLSANELQRMPRWRDAPLAVAAVQRWASVTRRSVMNPNTAPIEVMAAWWPQASPQQLQLLRSLRDAAPFTSGEFAQRATGLPAAGDEFIFSLGPELRITVSAEGSTRALQYNVMLTPLGQEAPWLISDVQPVPSAPPRDPTNNAQAFPLALPAARKP